MWAPLAPHVKLPAVCDSDLKDDTAQQGVLKCLQEFGQENGEAMFIISQLNFIDYLNKPCYTSAAAHLKYPRPEDLGPRFRRGEFDILLVHHHHGLVIGEIKSVGSNAVALNKTPDEMVADVAKKAARATRQLGEVQDGAEVPAQRSGSGHRVKATLIVLRHQGELETSSRRKPAAARGSEPLSWRRPNNRHFRGREALSLC
ncbi:uncharacterized protein LOC112557974 [Pomacea canaliculata]|uniref:uncharacterized protein LOC112557974 n=1 Tax=Pomacea canaliculata TaxID=400727 RepID=UPI000D72D097|nr:uncharacterized protein LOC112557974 [Pomacea canaliculata]